VGKYEVFCIPVEDNETECDNVVRARRDWNTHIPFKREIREKQSLYD